ncbi:MAG: MTAP family purine nucleoside phosphorylase [Candidatus Aquicultorales bacterium]
MIGIITGSGLYELTNLRSSRERSIDTGYGVASVTTGSLGGRDIAAIARHGTDHRLLPNMINHRANISALRSMGVRAILATSVMGVVAPDIPLGSVILFDDMFFMDNRLPDGTLCTFFDTPGAPGRGHYIFSQPFSRGLNDLCAAVCNETGTAHVQGAIYGHVWGPRFNSKAEIRYLKSAGVTAISQTAGPEAVLAGEVGVPYLLIGFGVDYANAVMETPTPVEVLDAKLRESSQILPRLLEGLVGLVDEEGPISEGFVYTFD